MWCVMGIRGMRTGISLDVTASDRERLLAVVGDRKSTLGAPGSCC